MPLVEHNSLPSFERLRLEGVEVSLPEDIYSSLPSIKIGFLNMMPDAALSATERQFLRLVASCSNVNCYVYPFNIQSVKRSKVAQDYVDEYYFKHESIINLDVDAMIITGANVSQPFLQNESFWSELVKVLEWSKKNVRSTLCSCLATHAAVKVFYGIDRHFLGDKCWGVFEHDVLLKQHPLVENVKDSLQMCHSRFNDIAKVKFQENNVDVLIDSEQAGVQLAAEKDLSAVYFQGHPEYDDISLLKEFKREIIRYLADMDEQFPPVPVNYFNARAMAFINDYQVKVECSDNKQSLLDEFPEDDLKLNITNSWKQAARQIFTNWVNIVAWPES